MFALKKYTLIYIIVFDRDISFKQDNRLIAICDYNNWFYTIAQIRVQRKINLYIINNAISYFNLESKTIIIWKKQKLD